MPMIEVGGKLYPHVGGKDPKRPVFGLDAKALGAASPIRFGWTSDMKTLDDPVSLPYQVAPSGAVRRQ